MRELLIGVTIGVTISVLIFLWKKFRIWVNSVRGLWWNRPPCVEGDWISISYKERVKILKKCNLYYKDLSCINKVRVWLQGLIN